MRSIFDFFCKFFPYIKGHKFSFAIALLASIVVAICTAGVTYLIEPLIDTLTGKVPRANPFFSFDEIAQNGHMALAMMLLIIGTYFGKSAGTYIQTYYTNFIGQDIVRQMRDRMLDHMLSLELAFFNKMRGGELLARITNDIGIIRLAVSNYITEFVRDGATIIGLIFIVLYQSPKYALICLVIIPLAIIPLRLIIKRLKRYSHHIQEKNADITAKLNEIFNNIEAIKVSNGEKLELNNFTSQNMQFLKINMKAVRVGELSTPLMELLGAIMLSFVVYMAIGDISQEKLSAAQFSSFIGALFLIYTPLKRLVNLYTQMQSAIVAGERIFEILNITQKINDGHTTLHTPLNTITLSDVHFNYDEETHALKGINLEFQKNKITALVGKSGSGKSSIINLILRLYEASKGEVQINGQNIKTYTQKSVRENMAIVTQKIFIFNDSILHNVAYSEKIDEARAIESLKKAHAWEFVEQMPKGIHTILDEFGTNLSGGQKQRIAIARAIYKNPEVLILDEATSALDSQTERAIKESIESLKKDKIIIIIAHRPTTIELADEVIHLHAGEITKYENR